MSTEDLSGAVTSLKKIGPRISRLLTKRLVLQGTAALILYLSVTPFIFVIWTSLWSGRVGSLEGTFTLQNYIDMYSNPEVYFLFINTLAVTLGMFVIAMTGGIVMAWLIGRTNIPGKGYLELVILAPYAIPSVIYALMFIFAFSPEAGLINHYWTEFTGLQAPLFNIYTIVGILLVMGIDAVTTVYLILIPSLTNMDPNLEESSRIHGANMMQTIRRISLPVIVPALASAGIIVLIRGIGTFASVAVIGVRFDFNVFATRIWEVTSQQFPPDYGYGTALGVTLLLMTGLLIYIYRRITARKEDYMVVTGEGYRPANWDLGEWKWPTAIGLWGVLLVFWIIPILVIVLASFHTLWEGEIIPQNLTLANFQEVLDTQQFWTGISNTLQIALFAAIAGTIIVTLAAYYTERTDYRFKGVVDFFLIAPMGFPGIILGTSVLITYIFVNNILGVNILGTIAIIVIGVVTKDLPTTSRIAIGNIVQVHDDLEEMARVAGANWSQQMRTIFLPLYKGTIGVLLFYWFIGATKTLTIPLMLYTAETMPISVYIFGEWYFSANLENVAVISVIFMGFMGAVLGFLKLFDIKFYELM